MDHYKSNICPLCKQPNFVFNTIDNKLAITKLELFTLQDIKNESISWSAPYTPSLVKVCKSCGYMALFNVNILRKNYPNDKDLQ